MMSSRAERLSFGLLFVVFTCFTWRGITMFYSGDDMMNMYNAWDIDAWRLAQAQLLIWQPVYRPVGGAVYRFFYEVFGFHPRPLYLFCWILLAGNVFAGYLFLRTVAATVVEALTALSLTLVHGNFADLYYSAGTIYDRLCFLFTTASLIGYVRFRRRPGWRSFTAVCLFSIFAMGSKESGVAVLPVILCCELLYFAPAAWRDKGVRFWIRQTGPLLITLIGLSALFVFGRVARTASLVATTAYAPRINIIVWLTHVAEYLTILTYRHVLFTIISSAILLAVMAVMAIAARNRTMMFGWLFFVISITPVALITSRPGYVLYLPGLGLGLFFAGAITWLTRPLVRHAPATAMFSFALVTIAAIWFHARNWPPVWDVQSSPERRLTVQFRRDYPTLPPNSRLLFASDEFPPEAYDLLFNLRLLYRDKSITAYRMIGSPEQKPDPIQPMRYDRIWSFESGQYVELDRRNPAESVRLNILRKYAVADEMDMARPDHSAYVVSGLQDGETNQPSRWTDPQAKFKFQLHAAPSVFTMKYWLPDYVAKPAVRTLSVLLDGKEIAAFVLDKPGMNEINLPIPADFVRHDGYTFVEMNVSNPYKDANGIEYGVVLLRAGFRYSPNSRKT